MVGVTRRTLAGGVAVVVAIAVLAILGGVVAGSGFDGGSVADDGGGRYAHHPTPEGNATPETTLVENGSVVNANADTPPGNCSTIRGERRVTIHAGQQYANPGEAFGYDFDSITTAPCTRLVVTLVNHDDVRHQWLVETLPTDTYPAGLFSVEADGRSRVTATFVTPAEPREYAGYCSLPQHEQNGMRLPLVIPGDSNEAVSTETTTSSDGTGTGLPGFGSLAALAALLAALLLAVRR